jgi:hypothetical protein
MAKKHQSRSGKKGRKTKSRKSPHKKSPKRSPKHRRGRPKGSVGGKHTLTDLRKFASRCAKRSKAMKQNLRGFSKLKRASLVNRIASAGC